MKIISWNCNGAFRKKLSVFEQNDADLLIIQESEDPSKSTSSFQEWIGDNYLWKGKNKNKGIGIFSRKGDALKLLDWPDDGILESFLPFKFNDKTFLAVWTKQANSPTFQYIGQLWKYMQLNKELFLKHKPIIIGDFNSNKVWDKWDRWWNHSDVVRELQDIGIESLYHHQFNQEQGLETSPTLYLRRHLDRPYHIDYVFLPTNLLPKASLNVGVYIDWIEFSDHMPLFINIDLTA